MARRLRRCGLEMCPIWTRETDVLQVLHSVSTQIEYPTWSHCQDLWLVVGQWRNQRRMRKQLMPIWSKWYLRVRLDPHWSLVWCGGSISGTGTAGLPKLWLLTGLIPAAVAAAAVVVLTRRCCFGCSQIWALALLDRCFGLELCTNNATKNTRRQPRETSMAIGDEIGNELDFPRVEVAVTYPGFFVTTALGWQQSLTTFATARWNACWR